MSFPGGDDARKTADAVARRSYGKLVAFLASRTRDVASAEDALAEAWASQSLASCWVTPSLKPRRAMPTLIPIHFGARPTLSEPQSQLH